MQLELASEGFEPVGAQNDNQEFADIWYKCDKRQFVGQSLKQFPIAKETF